MVNQTCKNHFIDEHDICCFLLVEKRETVTMENKEKKKTIFLEFFFSKWNMFFFLRCKKTKRENCDE